MKWFLERVKAEPAAIAAIINVILIQAIAYGFTISAEQLANWNMLIALILGFVTRQTSISTSEAVTKLQSNTLIKTAVSMPSTATVKDVIEEAKDNGVI